LEPLTIPAQNWYRWLPTAFQIRLSHNDSATDAAASELSSPIFQPERSGSLVVARIKTTGGDPSGSWAFASPSIPAVQRSFRELAVGVEASGYVAAVPASTVQLAAGTVPTGSNRLCSASAAVEPRRQGQRPDHSWPLTIRPRRIADTWPFSKSTAAEHRRSSR
jgi:hypothetical protein